MEPARQLTPYWELLTHLEVYPGIPHSHYCDGSI